MGEKPRIKICGLTNVEDAQLCAELGAWAVGMIFYERSPRRCAIDQAQLISSALRRRSELCGVFVNESIDQITRLAEDLDLTLIQLHGDEGPSFCAEVARRTGARVIKAIQVSDAGDVREIERFHVDFHLLDARSSAPGTEQLRGGTGNTFDWRLLSVRRTKVPLILSGGLHAGNVLEAIRATHPYAIDSASATELAPGRKDPRKLGELFAAVAECAGPVGSPT